MTGAKGAAPPALLAPGLMIAAPRSGSGKTTLTLGLLRAFRRRGLRAVGVKSGPDYIDPAFHAAATGVPSLNLDSWAMDPALLTALAARAARDCDILICEGSMGLFDGVPAAPGRTGASADVAVALGLPVVLLLDVSGQAQSAAAMVKGCMAYDPRITIAGVVLNRVGSARHLRLAGDAIAALGVAVLGALPKSGAVALPERHLGLVQAGETADLDARLDAMAAFVEEHVRLDDLLALAAPSLRAVGEATQGFEYAGPWIASPTARNDGGEGTTAEASPPSLRGAQRRSNPGPACGDPWIASPSARNDGACALPPPGPRIAIARDDAFSFIYPHILDGWRGAGAEVRFFSPLADEAPDRACDVCWLPGGYPELHAGRLAAADNFREGLRAFARQKPVHGECGGYMALGESLADAGGAVHRMAGLLSVRTSFEKRKMNLGYRDAAIAADGCLGVEGTRLRGHEFHYASVVDAGRDEPFAIVKDAYGGAATAAGGRRGRVTGSFFHVVARAAEDE
jgi:cobyrinic acid a,c-diamide synthase